MGLDFSFTVEGFDQETVDKTLNCVHSFVNDYRISKYILDQYIELRLMKLGVII
jgi:hypothetical protein